MSVGPFNSGVQLYSRFIFTQIGLIGAIRPHEASYQINIEAKNCHRSFQTSFTFFFLATFVVFARNYKRIHLPHQTFRVAIHKRENVLE